MDSEIIKETECIVISYTNSLINKYKEHRGEPFETLNIWNAIVTEQLKELLNRACEVQRVAGAWAALIAGPTVMSAIDIVYETEVDEFDNEELYTQGAYFILRAIMKMHGTEI